MEPGRPAGPWIKILLRRSASFSVPHLLSLKDCIVHILSEANWIASPYIGLLTSIPCRMYHANLLSLSSHIPLSLLLESCPRTVDSTPHVNTFLCWPFKSKPQALAAWLSPDPLTGSLQPREGFLSSRGKFPPASPHPLQCPGPFTSITLHFPALNTSQTHLSSHMRELWSLCRGGCKTGPLKALLGERTHVYPPAIGCRPRTTALCSPGPPLPAAASLLPARRKGSGFWQARGVDMHTSELCVYVRVRA